MGLVAGRFPNDGPAYPKMRREAAVPDPRARSSGSRGAHRQGRAELWDALYLRQTEVEELLTHIRDRAGHAWIHPQGLRTDFASEVPIV